MKRLVLVALVSLLVVCKSALATTPEEYNACCSYLCAQSNVVAFAPDSFGFEVSGEECKMAYWNVPSVPKPTLAQLESLKDVAVPWSTAHKYSIKVTPEWVTLTNSIAVANVSLDGYAPLKTNLTTSIGLVTDAKSKAALNDAKSIIQQLQEEIKALQDEVRALRKVVGKNVMLCEP